MYWLCDKWGDKKANIKSIRMNKSQIDLHQHSQFKWLVKSSKMRHPRSKISVPFDRGHNRHPGHELSSGTCSPFSRPPTLWSSLFLFIVQPINLMILQVSTYASWGPTSLAFFSLRRAFSRPPNSYSANPPIVSNRLSFSSAQRLAVYFH